MVDVVGAAMTIQRAVRIFLAKTELSKRRAKQKEYEQIMEKLQKEAFLKQAQQERERQARLRQAETEARDRKKEEVERKKKLLEAAYDGDAKGIKEILDTQRRLAASSGHGVIARSLAARRELALVEARDGSGNTCLSESANSGACDVIKLLLEKGADVNSRGAYNRTPLFRAAFAGNEEAVLLLLKSGADPRHKSDDGQTSLDVAATNAITKILSSWDLASTARKAAANRASRRKADELQLAGIRAEKNEIGLKMDALKEEYEKKQKDLEDDYASLTQLRTEFNRLYSESEATFVAILDDFSPSEKTAKEKTSAATASSAPSSSTAQEKLQSEINSAELRLEATKIDTEKIGQQLEEVRSSFKAKELEEGQYDDNDEGDGNEKRSVEGGGGGGGGDAPNGKGVKVDDAVSHIPMNIQFRALEDVLMKDKTNNIKKSRKWPLLMDVTDRSATFLKYRDTNYVNALDPAQMKPDVVRIALLGAMRYGKPIVFDMMDLDRHGAVEATLEAIRPNLFQDLLDFSLLRDDKKIENLIKEQDGDQYRITRFTKDGLDKFKCIFVTKNRFPAPGFLQLVFPIKIN